MGQVIFIGFFTAAAVSLALLGYFTGKYEAYEEMEDISERKEKKSVQADTPDSLCGSSRRDKRINYDLRRLWYGAGGETDKWDIEIPDFLDRTLRAKSIKTD